MYIFYKSSKKKNVDKDITIIFLYLHLFKRKIINAMRQAHLIWIADHRLDIKQQDEILSLCLQIDVKDLLQNALDVQAQLENYKIPEIAQSLTYQHTDSDGEMYFSVNDIEIRIAKHLIQFRFPFIFRVLVDFELLRNKYNAFLHEFLAPFQTSALIAYPSFWNYEEYEIRNEWHRRRLYELQNKIVNTCHSFHRTRLNLKHALGESDSDSKQIMAKKYRVWIEIAYSDLLK